MVSQAPVETVRAKQQRPAQQAPGISVRSYTVTNVRPQRDATANHIVFMSLA